MQLNKNESWLPVKGFELLYEVSDLGQIKSIPNDNRYRPKHSRILKQQISIYGYKVVTLVKDKRKYFMQSHRIVASTFCENKHNKPCVNHINGIKTDNRAINLEWCTYSENAYHSYLVLGKNIKGVKKNFKNGVNPKCKKILCVEKKVIFNSLKLAADSLKLHRSNIAAQANGKIKKCGGFTFKFI